MSKKYSGLTVDYMEKIQFKLTADFILTEATDRSTGCFGVSPLVSSH